MVHETLNEKGCRSVRVPFYHAKVYDAERALCHHAWSNGQCDVLCTTIGFGMWIDKPDVQYVIHFAMPKLITHYYLESGCPCSRQAMYEPEPVSITIVTPDDINNNFADEMGVLGLEQITVIVVNNKESQTKINICHASQKSLTIDDVVLTAVCAPLYLVLSCP